MVVHGIAAVGMLASNLWQVDFPTASPLYSVAFVFAAAPPPPPPPPPKPIEVKQPEMTTAKLLLATDLLAPTVIPDEIPVVKPQIVQASAFAVPEGYVGGVPDGVVSGVIGGIVGGEAGGVKGGTIGGVVDEQLPQDGRVHIPRDKRLPMLPLSQTYPVYPENARLRAWEDSLVVRYIIGKDGRVREVSIISAPERDVFSDTTLRAIRGWRFKPMIKDGERVEVVHELTVFFRLNAAS